MPVTCLPGPSALTAAAALSGFSADRLVFDGRPPRARQQLIPFLRQRCGERSASIFFVEERDLAPMLEVLAAIWPVRMIVLAQNLTMEDESIRRGTARSLLELGIPILRGIHRKLNTTLVVEGTTTTLRPAGRRKAGRSA